MEVSLAPTMMACLGAGACQRERATGCGLGKLHRVMGGVFLFSNSSFQQLFVAYKRRFCRPSTEQGMAGR